MSLRQRLHARYIKSLTWKERRAQVLARDGWKCQQCGLSGIHLEVDHKTYSRWMEESLEDLWSLCPPCHSAVGIYRELVGLGWKDIHAQMFSLTHRRGSEGGKLILEYIVHNTEARELFKKMYEKDGQRISGS